MVPEAGEADGERLREGSSQLDARARRALGGGAEEVAALRDQARRVGECARHRRLHALAHRRLGVGVGVGVELGVGVGVGLVLVFVLVLVLGLGLG